MIKIYTPHAQVMKDFARNKTWRNLFCCVLLAIMLSWSHLALAAVAKVTDVEVSQAADVTRLTFDIDGAYHYQWQLQPGARQLVINLTPATLATNLPAARWLNTLIANARASTVSQTQLQIQLTLKTPVNVTITSAPPSGAHKNQLLVELKPRMGATIAAYTRPQSNKLIKPNKPEPNKSPLPTPVKPPAPPAPVARADQNGDEIKAWAATSSTPRVTLGNTASKQTLTVIIDPGHGGKDSGAVGPNGAREKDVVLAVSKRLQQLFSQQPGFHVVLTRTQDVFIPLRQRLAIARQCRADLFIAIHADAAYNQDAIGASVFALSERGATSEGARILAEKENQSELLYGVTVGKDQILRSVLMDLSQTHTIAVSLEMGQTILRKLSNITKLHYVRVEQAAFVVLKSPDIPSLLVETGYISNPNQEQKLRDPSYQQQLAMAIVQGVIGYFAQHPPSQKLITT